MKKIKFPKKFKKCLKKFAKEVKAVGIERERKKYIKTYEKNKKDFYEFISTLSIAEKLDCFGNCQQYEYKNMRIEFYEAGYELYMLFVKTYIHITSQSKNEKYVILLKDNWKENLDKIIKELKESEDE